MEAVPESSPLDSASSTGSVPSSISATAPPSAWDPLSLWRFAAEGLDRTHDSAKSEQRPLSSCRTFFCTAHCFSTLPTTAGTSRMCEAISETPTDADASGQRTNP